MDSIITCESQYNVAIQSKYRYSEKNVPRGYNVGDREQSFGLVQIHLPAHPNVSYHEAIDPVFAANFLAQGIKNGNVSAWSCAKTIAMR